MAGQFIKNQRRASIAANNLGVITTYSTTGFKERAFAYLRKTGKPGVKIQIVGVLDDTRITARIVDDTPGSAPNYGLSDLSEYNGADLNQPEQGLYNPNDAYATDSSAETAESCVVGPNLLSSPGDMTGAGWNAYGNVAAAPTVTPNYGVAPDGTTTSNRIQFAQVTTGESTVYQTIAGLAGVVSTYSLYIRSTSGGSGPSSGSIPLATAEGGRDGQNPDSIPFTAEWTRHVITKNNTGTISAFWLGYVQEYSGTGPAMDLEIWAPKVERGEGGASPYVCPSPLQEAYIQESGYIEEKITADWGITSRDGAGLVTTGDGTLVLLGGWKGTPQAEWGNHVTTNQIYKSTNNGATWTVVLAHDDDPPQTGVGQRWRRRHTQGTLLVTIGGTEYIYVIAGDAFNSVYGPESGPYPTDVWRSPASTYGATWERMTDAAEWGSRVLPMVWAMGETLYLAGGQTNVNSNITAKNDVWKSEDGGATWTLVTEHAPWVGRGAISNVLPTFDNKVWITGGLVYDSNAGSRLFFNDVWSFDGQTWILANPDADWAPRGFVNSATFGGKLWVLKGTGPDMFRDAWFSTDGIHWSLNRGAAGQTDHAGSVTVNLAGTKMIICGGTGNNGGRVYSINSP